MNMDLIPVKVAHPSPDTDVYKVGNIEITKKDAAILESINQLIEWNRELQARLIKVEGK